MPCYSDHLIVAGIATLATAGTIFFTVRRGMGLNGFLSRIGAMIIRSKNPSGVWPTIVGAGLLYAVVVTSAWFGAVDACAAVP